ncbi:IS5/IS1182 family transposase, partial [Marinomonas sp. E8]|nr:IS5/IS1182 family transposase [Marinomonas algarum]
MMNQLSFADTEFTSKRRKTRKELFLSRMDELIPWQQ